MFQNRHGGLPLYFYKLWSYVLPPEWLHPAWIAFWNAINLGLFFKVLQKFNSQRWIIYTVSFCLLIDPIFIYNYAFFISEPLTITCAFLCALLFLNGGRKKNNWAFYILGLGFYIRLNFLWFTIFLIPLIWKAFKENKKSAVLFFGLGILPQLVFMDWAGIFVEVSEVQDQSSIFMAFIWAIRALVFKLDYLGYYGFGEDNPFLTSPLLFIFCFLFLSLVSFSRFKLFMITVLFSSVILVCYLAGNDDNYPLYYFYLPFVFWLYIGGVKIPLKGHKGILLVLGVIFHLNNSLATLEHFLIQGFNSRHNLSLYQEVNNYVVEKKIPEVFLLNHTSRGILEYLSQDRIKTKNLDFHVRYLGLRDINDLIMEIDESEGYLLIIKNDYWSSWYKNFYHYNFERQIELSLEYKIKLEIKKKFLDQIYLIYFEKR